MSQTIETQRSWSRPAVTEPNVAQWLDLDIPSIEDLLHRLAATQATKQLATPTRRFGPWKMAAVCAVCFICAPGSANPAGIFIKSDNSGASPIQIEAAVDRTSAKADRLPLMATPANYFNDANYFDEAKIRDEDDPVEPPGLRGTVHEIALAVASAEPLPAIRPKLRRGIRAAFARMPAEIPDPAPRPPSLLEKLFSAFVPQFNQPPSQRQM